jgi:hypothetical protein
VTNFQTPGVSAGEGGRLVRWIVFPAVLAALVLALAGCGGSDSSDASSSDDTTSIETSSDDTSTETAEEAEATGEDTSGVDLSGSGLSDDCQALVQASAKYSEAFSSLGSGGSLDVQGAADALQGVADSAPEAIQGAYQTLAEAIGKYAEALDGVDLSSGATPDPATLAKISAAAQSFSTSEVTQATQEISDWTTENCGQGAP